MRKSVIKKNISDSVLLRSVLKFFYEDLSRVVTDEARSYAEIAESANSDLPYLAEHYKSISDSLYEVADGLMYRAEYHGIFKDDQL